MTSKEAHPGHVVSVLTPTGQSAKPFLLRAGQRAGGADTTCTSFTAPVASAVRWPTEPRPLHGGLASMPYASPLDGPIPPPGIPADWDLLSAGVFEQDVETSQPRHRGSQAPPRKVCAVAAGVREFGHVVDDPDGIYGIAQWFPGSGHDVELGPAESEFLGAYTDRTGTTPDYPAVQAVAGAVIAFALRAAGRQRKRVMTYGQLRPPWKHRPSSGASGSTRKRSPA